MALGFETLSSKDYYPRRPLGAVQQASATGETKSPVTPSSQIVLFDSAGSNLQDLTAYLGSAIQTGGFAAGLVDPTVLNRILHQSSFMATGLANFIVSQGVAVNDDNNVTNLVSEIQQALTNFGYTITGSTFRTMTTSTSQPVPVPAAGTVYAAGAAITLTPAKAANFVNGNWFAVTAKSGAVTVTPNGADTIAGVAAPYSLTSGSNALFVRDDSGTNWNVMFLSNPNGFAPTLGRSTKTTTYTAVAGDQATMINATSGTWTLSLTAPATLTNKWWAILQNSGTGTITLSSLAGTVDGLASYAMYPGEARIIQTDGANFFTVVLNPFSMSITSSMSFIIPPGYPGGLEGLAWAAGAGGGGGITSGGAPSNPPGGGGGGACVPFRLFSPGTPGTTITITLGAGGAGGNGASGAAGGNTTVGSFVTAYGGAAGTIGGGAGLPYGFGGGGGGCLGAPSTTVGGAPLGALQGNGSNAATEKPDNTGFGGGSGGAGVSYTGGSGNGGNSGYGGGGGGGLIAGAGGGSIYGGGGGATNSAAPGASVFGGIGGTAGSTNGNGGNGAQPGGGGGAGGSPAGNTTVGGNGGAGQVNIWGVL